jgi:C4-dicarboxylate-specific signal transduction histidine kinase
MHRFFKWCEDHAFVVTLILFGFLLVTGIGYTSLQANQHTSQVRAEAKTRAKAVESEAKARAEALAAANLDVCRRAVTSVTNQLNSDLLQIIKTIEDRLIEQGRPVPGVYLQLEDLISNRQPPLAACEPKGNP